MYKNIYNAERHYSLNETSIKIDDDKGTLNAVLDIVNPIELPGYSSQLKLTL